MIRAAILATCSPGRLTDCVAWAQTELTELKNSKHSGIRTRETCGFFVPDASASGGVRSYNRRKPKTARRLCSVLNLPTSSGRRVNTFPRVHAARTGDIK